MMTLGADPELFVIKNGYWKSIVGLIGGTKDNPKIIDDNGQFKIQEDNVAAEYNIPPSYTKEQFVANILWPQQYLKVLLGAKDIVISKKASALFPETELQTRQAQTFGCDPDYNAWRNPFIPNIKPEAPDKRLRTCGGHVHFGIENPTPETIVKHIKNMDKVLGVWSVVVDPDDTRKLLYGKAGAYRPQIYGGEYRVLSNFWIFKKELIEEVWDRASYAITYLDEPTPVEGLKIQQIINTGNKANAKEYLRVNGLT